MVGSLLRDELEPRYRVELVSLAKKAAVNSTGRCNYPFELSGWSDEAERLAGPAVQLERDAVEGRSHAVDASLRVRLARCGRDDVEVHGCVIEEAPGTV
jgi:hypothetical protein